jgi:hypothetical protein
MANFQFQGRFLGLFLVLMKTSIPMETMGSLFHNFIIGNHLQQQPFRAPLPKVPGEGVSGGVGKRLALTQINIRACDDIYRFPMEGPYKNTNGNLSWSH